MNQSLHWVCIEENNIYIGRDWQRGFQGPDISEGGRIGTEGGHRELGGSRLSKE